jgi:hypothetical protein
MHIDEGKVREDLSHFFLDLRNVLRIKQSCA